MNDNNNKDLPHIAVVCSTYRNPANQNNTARMMGLTALVTQFLAQDYQGKISISILDDSPEPHPFVAEVAKSFPEKILYLHVPERNNINPEYRALYPRAMEQIPTDADLKTPYWQWQKEKMKSWARFIPFEEDFPRPVDIVNTMDGVRPTIGMKKNAGVLAIAEAFGTPQQIVFTDDDDYHGPSYVSDVVKGLGSDSFTRINRYIVNIDNPKISDKPVWGLYDLPFQKDVNGYHYMTPEMKADRILTSEVSDSGEIRTLDPADFFKRMMMLAWSPVSHEGALHSYNYDIWERGLEAFGGSPPCNFGEDVILYRMMKDYFGREFTSNMTEVSADPMKMNFLRTSDGTNASYLIYNKTLAEDAKIPVWAQESMRHYITVKNAVDNGADLGDLMAKLGKDYVATGKFEPEKIIGGNDGRRAPAKTGPAPQG